MAEEPGPAGIAAIDQQLAGISARLDRNHRRIMYSEVTLLLIALAAVIYILAARPAVSYWYLACAWAVVALSAAGNIFQSLMLRSYRAEIRDLRPRVPRA
jgi:fatty acid desaturase